MSGPFRACHRTALALAVCLLATLALAQVPAARPAVAAGADTGPTTTASSRTVAWTDRARNPADLADPAVNDALKGWSLRVSQTKDLLNQTVEVSWAGAATTGSGTFVQLMQCWSDGPEIRPTREQCAYGGVNREGAEGSGAGRTRALTADARERDYLYDGDLNPISVNGAVAPKTWGTSAAVELGTNQQACPPGTVGHTLTMVPPRDAVGPDLPASIVLEGPTTGLPRSVTRKEGDFTRTYATVTAPFTLSEAAVAKRLPLGQYRFQLACNRAGGVETARFVGYLEQFTSPAGPLWRQSSREGGVFVPFDPLGSTADTAPTDPYDRDSVLEYLKPRSSNEVWQARTRPDGRGSVFMEMQTDLEAQHLGCGRVDAGRPRSCWLVAVPRWTPEPDGQAASLPSLASPLSQTLWDRRIDVPLAFAPVASGCKIGSGLKQVLAHDSALAALRSWQPTFCDDSATASSVLGPLQDGDIRSGIAAANRMGVVTTPEQDRPTVVRAPIATSGVVVAFTADRQIPFGSPLYQRNETRADVMNLNARLLAKLLTQSYDSGAAPNGGKTSGYNGSVFSGGFLPTFTPARRFPANNPRTLYQDPEFLRLNPDFAEWLAQGANMPPTVMADVLVSANDTDAYQVLWRWVLGDPEAARFLQGGPDPDGMRVNPYYQGQLTAETTSFPILDPTCVDNIQDPAAATFPLLCQINNHPRVNGDVEAAQSAVRGDTRRVNVAPSQLTGAVGELSYKAEQRQEQGRAGLLVITTSAVAERFGLPTARLKNAGGRFVQATAASLSAARDQMAARADGVLQTAPAAVREGGYPLTTNSYAVVDVAATTQAQNDAFAKILVYAAGDGQRSGTAIGQLPPGYAPLSDALRLQTRAAAALLRNPSSLLPAAPSGAAGPAGPPGPPSRGSDGSPVGDSPVGGPAGADPGTGAAAAPGQQPVSAAGTPGMPGRTGAVGASPVLAAGVAPQVAARVATTRSPTSGLTWFVPVLLLVGLVAALAGRVVRLLGRNPSRP